MNGLPTGGFTLSKTGADDAVNVARRGRPESESDTPVNIGNGPYRDNGEGVAATPLPYPLEWSSVGRSIQPLWKLLVDGAGCSLSRRTGEGQGEGRFVKNMPHLLHMFLHKPLPDDYRRNWPGFGPPIFAIIRWNLPIFFMTCCI